MLNGYTDQHYNRFNETKLVIIKDILFSDDLEQLSELYDDSFLVPMRAKGGRPSSRPQSASERVQGQERDSHSSSIKSNVFKTAVRDRDDNRCVLTGETDISPLQPDTRKGHQVAHFIPQSLLDETRDEDKRKAVKNDIRGFIMRLCPWLPSNFFENLDVCENAILLNTTAHSHFGAFNWFVVMETSPDGSIVYKASQVEENGLLRERNTGREFELENGAFLRISSFNQPLFIGNTHSQPGELYVRLHELLARIFKMRGQAGYYEIDSDEEYEPVDNSEIITKIAARQDSLQTLNNQKTESF
jgi:hypothetical protein